MNKASAPDLSDGLALLDQDRAQARLLAIVDRADEQLEQTVVRLAADGEGVHDGAGAGLGREERREPPRHAQEVVMLQLAVPHTAKEGACVAEQSSQTRRSLKPHFEAAPFVPMLPIETPIRASMSL